jgi:hypothetical protein
MPASEEKHRECGCEYEWSRGPGFDEVTGHCACGASRAYILSDLRFRDRRELTLEQWDVVRRFG